MCSCARAPLSPDFTTVSDYNDVFLVFYFQKAFTERWLVILNLKINVTIARDQIRHVLERFWCGAHIIMWWKWFFYSTLPYDSKPVDYYVLKLHSISYFCLRGNFAVCILSKSVLIRRKGARICTLKMPFLVFLNLGMLPWTSREKNKVGRKMCKISVDGSSRSHRPVCADRHVQFSITTGKQLGGWLVPPG